LAVLCALLAVAVMSTAVAAVERTAAVAEAEVEVEDGDAVDVGTAAATDFRFTDVAKAATADHDEDVEVEDEEDEVDDDEEEEDSEHDEAAGAALDALLETATEAEGEEQAEAAELAEALSDSDADLLTEAEAADRLHHEVDVDVAAEMDAEALAVAEAQAESLSTSTAGSTFNEQLARDHVRYSSAAYFTRPTDDVLRCLTYWGISTIKVVKQVDMAIGTADHVGAFVGVDNTKQRIVVAFRGTNSPGQLLTEALQSTRVQVADCAGGTDCWVMKYFQNANDALCTVLSPIVRQLVVANPSFKVHISGHSLGGAVAAMCAFSMRKQGIFQDAIFYTFGQPRVGNKGWADRFASWFPNAIRVTHHYDPVPRVPPCATQLFPLPKPGCTGAMGPLRYGYHFPGEVFYPNTIFNTYKVCSGSEDQNCIDGGGLGISITDHLTYLDVPVGTGCSQLRSSS